MMKNERIFIKGFDKDLKCRDYQFEVGKEYKIDLPDKYKLTAEDLCSDKVFHFCDSFSKVHKYYNCYNNENRYCIIEVLGQLCEHLDKCGSDHIKIVREITGNELKITKGLINGNSGLFNSGNFNSGEHNSGHRNSGDFNNGDCNSGDHNCGDCNSGDGNRGSFNSGNWNSGNLNNGDWNKGNFNSGYWNSGNGNSGKRNNGNWNNGIFNKTNYANGIFCNQSPKICIFNIQTDWTMSEFIGSKFYNAIFSSVFPLTEWKTKENANGIERKLIVNSYEEACNRWWDGMTEKNKEIIKQIPNFDIDVFCDITGIPREKV